MKTKTGHLHSQPTNTNW